jgi:gliding motility-associated lipoprotein GldD
MGSLLVMGLAMACSEGDPVPRPYGYAKAVLPSRKWASCQPFGFPVQFEYNTTAFPRILPSGHGFANEGNRPQQEGTLWMNLDYPELRAQIHLSYHPLNKVFFGNGQQVPVADALSVLMAETQRMTFKHTLKASGIEEMQIQYPDQKVYGMLYTVRGNAASQTQFYATDSLRHYLRGSLYFGATPNADSLQPYSDYILEDVRHLLATLKWSTQGG